MGVAKRRTGNTALVATEAAESAALVDEADHSNIPRDANGKPIFFILSPGV
jgi:hypothetical protein